MVFGRAICAIRASAATAALRVIGRKSRPSGAHRIHGPEPEPLPQNGEGAALTADMRLVGNASPELVLVNCAGARRSRESGETLAQSERNEASFVLTERRLGARVPPDCKSIPRGLAILTGR